MSEHIDKSHNKSLLLYHFVCPIKFRRKVLRGNVSTTFKDVCLKIEERYEIHFLEIGLDDNHAHFLIQSVPMNAPKKISGAVKSLLSKRFFAFTLRSNKCFGVVIFGQVAIMLILWVSMQVKK